MSDSGNLEPNGSFVKREQKEKAPFGLIGARLREERERLGLSQAEFGAQVQLTGKTQGLYERDVRVPDANYLALAAALGVDVGYVLTGIRTVASPAAAGDTRAEYRAVSPREARILDLIEDMDDDVVKQVQDIAEKEKLLKELKEENARLKSTA